MFIIFLHDTGFNLYNRATGNHFKYVKRGDVLEVELRQYCSTHTEIIVDNQSGILDDFLFAIMHPQIEPFNPMPKILISFPFETLLDVRSSLTSEVIETITLAPDEPFEVEAINDGDEGTKCLYLGGFKLVYNAPGNLQIL